MWEAVSFKAALCKVLSERSGVTQQKIYRSPLLSCFPPLLSKVIVSVIS